MKRMTAEELYIRNIESGIRVLKLKTKEPSHTNMIHNLNKLKVVNEGMYSDYLVRYEKALREYYKHNENKELKIN